MKKLCVLFLCSMFIFSACAGSAFGMKNSVNSASNESANSASNESANRVSRESANRARHESANRAGYGKAIDAVAERYIGKSVPGACVIISEHNKIVCAKAYGYSDLEKKKPMNCEDSVFEWGSISKTFVWVCAMKLAEQGKLDLNEDIKRYLPKGFLKKLHYDNPITMLNLMNHTAGFEEQLIDLRYLNGDREKTLAHVLSEHQPEQVFAPGKISAYSNRGAALAGFIVERVSDQNYKEYVKKHILAPLKMRNTSVDPFWSDIPGLLSKKSKGYSFSKGKFSKEAPMHLRMYPAGTVNGSAGDLLRYACELAKGYKKSSALFRDPATKKQMFTQSYRSYGANAGLSHGFWQYAGNSGILGHEGGTYGFKVQFWVEPEKERAILIMTNVMETEFCSDVMKAIVPEKPYGEPGKVNKAATADKSDKAINEGRGVNGGKADKAVNIKKLEGDYLPARSAWKNAGKIQGRINMISIAEGKNGGICFTRPFKGKKAYYEPLKSNVFIRKDARPEERILAFNVRGGKVRSMTFRLAHEYVPAKVTQGKIGTATGLGVYLAASVLFLIYLLINIFMFLRKRDKRRDGHRLRGLHVAICGTLLGVCGIAGMLHWFSVYSLISHELIAVVAAGWICATVGMAGAICGYIKQKTIGSVILSLIFAAQCSAAYYLGFLTMI